jgi:hypothetical protein
MLCVAYGLNYASFLQTDYLMAAYSTLETHSSHPEHAASLSLAKHMLNRANEAANAIALLPQARGQNDDVLARKSMQLLMV